MKFQARLAAIFIICAFVFCGCTVSNMSSDSVQTPQSADSVASVSLPEPIVPSSAASEPNITIDEAMQISLELSDGYDDMLSIVQFQFGSSSQYITVDGVDYYYREDFPSTRNELEELLAQHFSSEFVERNMTKFFSPDENYMDYIQIIEQDGLLYYHEPGGIGGTYALWEDSLEVQDLSSNGWMFTMLGTTLNYDTGKETANENDICTFSVISENGRWVIDSYERTLSDGTVHDVG